MTPAPHLTCEQLAAELGVSVFAVLDLLDDAVICANENLGFAADQTVAARAHLHAARTGMTARTVRLPAQLHLGVQRTLP